jgi:hypothetical protein
MVWRVLRFKVLVGGCVVELVFWEWGRGGGVWDIEGR